MRLHRFALLLVLVLSACGGGEAEGETTRADFIARADELCAEHNEKLEQATEQLVSKPPPLSKEELETPSGDEAVAAYMDRIQRTADGLKDADGFSDAVQRALQNSTLEASGLAQDVGLEVCSSSPQI